MKKSRILSLLLILCLGLVLSIGSVSATNFVETTTARYEVVENVEENDLFYGVMQRTDRGLTKSTQVTPTVSYPQQVNVLEVPTDLSTKIVVWGSHSSSGWIRKTVTDFAKDFEANNPGWVVLAAVNADFFDIKSKQDLPQQTSGAMLQDGELVRSIPSGSTVGFTNDGTTNSLIGGKKFETSGFKLAIYDEFEHIIATYDVAKTNTVPADNEISVYFATQKRVEDDSGKVSWIVTPSVLPATEGREYIVGNAIKALPTDANNFYGIGEINETDVEKELRMGQFGIISNNEEANEKLAQGVKIRVQRDVIGDYADCTSITGAGYQMLKDGEEVVSTNLDRHPRTIVGKKEDGTVVLVTVDGRQPTKDMHGVIYGEMAAVMKYYDCVEAYNLDGGGSTTMIIRDGKGGFRIMNSPSDGGERRDSNAILVVAPELFLTHESVSDTEAKFSYPSLVKGYDIKKVVVTLNGETKTMVDRQVTFDNLDPNTTYNVDYNYEMERDGLTYTVNAKTQTIKTGKRKPVIDQFEVTLKGNEYHFKYDVKDPDGAIDLLAIEYEDGLKFIDVDEKSVTFTKADFGKEYEEFTLTIHYNLRSSVPSTEIINETVTVEVIEEPGDKGGCKLGTADLVNYFLGFSASLGLAFIVLKNRK